MLREHAPLYYNDRYDFYAVSRYEDCERGLADWGMLPSSRGGILELIKSGMAIRQGHSSSRTRPSTTEHCGVPGFAQTVSGTRFRVLMRPARRMDPKCHEDSA